jgi:hypothetical protein
MWELRDNINIQHHWELGGIEWEHKNPKPPMALFPRQEIMGPS